MFTKEYRPLKRPKLGVPDYYPQESKQKEDDLSYSSLNSGFRSQSVLPSGEEFQGALKEFTQHFLTTKEYWLKVNLVEDERRRRRWVQDSEKKKLQVSKDNFFPVPLGRNRKEIATQWFTDLASNKPLSQLAKKVPIFNKKEEIYDNLCEKDVPISRAAWYIKMSSAYAMSTDSKLNKKKQATDPSLEWTISLTKYMHESVWRICNESQISGRHDTHGGRTSSTSGRQSPSDETLMEITHWQYMLHLSSWLYEENLLVKYEFLRWLVDRIEHVKSNDTKALQLHLPLVLRHLLDIANCVSLARPLVTYCCERLAALFELEQRLHKLHPVVKPEPALEPVPEGGEDDSVFSEPAIKQEPGKDNTKSRKRSTADKKDDPSPTPVVNSVYEDNLYFHWCSHHQAVMLELVCTIQTIAIRCPTAFVQMKVPGGRGILMRESDKVSSPLAILPCSLSELPMPTSLKPELQKKLLSGLAAAEAEIIQRNKAAESRWSSMTVADLQTTSEEWLRPRSG